MQRLIEPSKDIKDHLTALMNFIKRKRSSKVSPSAASIRIGGYNLVLMDRDGQVVWTRDWDTGGGFELGPRHSLWVFCTFTNRSAREAEISEYEIELVGDDGQVVRRFGDSFGDSVVVMPGQSRVFSGQWQL